MLPHSEEYLDINISDLHKDAYGFRPSSGFWKNWEAASLEEKQQTWDQIVSVLDADDSRDYDDDMDGDAASALASAGWGTDEDYGGSDSIDNYYED